MAQITPGVTPWLDAWTQVNRNSRLADGLGIGATDDTPQKVVDRLIGAVATGAPMTQPSGGDGLLAVRNGKACRIDVGGAAFAAFVASLAGLAGTNVVPASADDLWAEVPGFLLVTPEALSDADAVQTGSAAISISAGKVSFDGAKMWRCEAIISSDVDFASPLNLTGRPRHVRLIAAGGVRTVTATGADNTVGMGAGIAIPDGKFADFEWAAGPGGSVVRHLGTSE